MSRSAATSTAPESNAPAQGAPSLLAVFTGVGALLFGVINGLFFTIMLAAMLQSPPENAPPVAVFLPGLLALADVFTLLHLPASFGVFLTRTWAMKLTTAVALGVFLSSALGVALCFSGIPHGYPDAVAGVFSWGLMSSLVWLVLAGLAASALKPVAPSRRA